MTGAISSLPLPAMQASLAGMATVTVPAATCVVRLPNSRASGGAGTNPRLKARYRSIPLSARNHGGGVRPRTGSSGITEASYQTCVVAYQNAAWHGTTTVGAARRGAYGSSVAGRQSSSARFDPSCDVPNPLAA